MSTECNAASRHTTPPREWMEKMKRILEGSGTKNLGPRRRKSASSKRIYLDAINFSSTDGINYIFSVSIQMGFRCYEAMVGVCSCVWSNFHRNVFAQQTHKSEQWLCDTTQCLDVSVLERKANEHINVEASLAPSSHQMNIKAFQRPLCDLGYQIIRYFDYFVIYVQIVVRAYNSRFSCYPASSQPASARTWTEQIYHVYQVTLIALRRVLLAYFACSVLTLRLFGPQPPLPFTLYNSHSISIVVRCFQSHLRYPITDVFKIHA